MGRRDSDFRFQKVCWIVYQVLDWETRGGTGVDDDVKEKGEVRLEGSEG